MDEDEHVILVAFNVTGKSRKKAHKKLTAMLAEQDLVGRTSVESWWVAEDDSIDGSDNDSAVFIPKGYQMIVSKILHALGLTHAHNVVVR